MTKEQKILLMFVLAIAASSATYYVIEQKKSSDVSAVESSSNTSQPNPPAPLPVTPETPGTGSQAVNAQTQTQTAPKAQSRPFNVNLSYVVPNGNQENISVEILVDSKGVIEDVSFSHETPSNRESSEYLGKFSKSFNESLLVGKNIKGAEISRVGGASLTTKAFNKALVEIATKAAL